MSRGILVLLADGPQEEDAFAVARNDWLLTGSFLLRTGADRVTLPLDPRRITVHDEKAWEPDWKVHPGESVHEARQEAKLTVREAAAKLGIAAGYLSDIENGRRDISPQMALRLEKVGWGTARLWIGMQGNYDLKKAREA